MKDIKSTEIELSEEMNRRIILAAFEEFNKSGLKFKMDDVAKNLKISKRTLYEIVSSKEMLINLVIDSSFADVKRQQKAVFEDDSLNTLEKLRALLNIIPDYSRYVDYRRVQDIKETYPDTYKRIENYLSSDWEGTLELFRKAMDEGCIRKKKLTVIKALFTNIFNSLLSGRNLIESGITYEEALEESMDIIFSGLEKR